MTEAELVAEFAELVFPAFCEQTAWDLGSWLVEAARADGLPVVIQIRTADRVMFQAALPGSAPLNDLWLRRKSNTALLFQLPTLLVGTRNRDKAETLARHGLDPAGYADNGGAVPIVVRGTGVVACLTVSGLPQVEDHRLAVRALRAVLAQG